jgi:energy-coupling factor transport system substrate-specific component
MHRKRIKQRLTIRDITIFAALGAIMYISKLLMLWIPNVHFLGLFIAAATLTYRVRALLPLYVYIMLDGVFYGFSVWWVPSLYTWLPLWLVFMLAGKLRLPKKVKVPLYMVLCALHGLSYGTLYAPMHALMFGLNFHAMLAWIAAGLWFDIAHAVGNFAAASLIFPLSALLRKFDAQSLL